MDVRNVELLAHNTDKFQCTGSNMKPAYKTYLQTCCILALLLPFQVWAEADRAWPILTFTCDKAKNEVKLKNEVIWGKAGEKFPFSAEQGTYNPWDLVNIVERGPRKLVSEKTQLNLRCRLSKSEYTIVIKPKIFNPNFYGKCGDRLSAKVSIYNGAAELISDKDMEKFCHGNSPVLRGIKVKGSNSKVKLYEIARSRFY